MSIKDKLVEIGRILDDSLNNPNVIDVDEETDIEAVRLTVRNLESTLTRVMELVGEISNELAHMPDK